VSVTVGLWKHVEELGGGEEESLREEGSGMGRDA
jgi:hypothetical protein